MAVLVLSSTHKREPRFSLLRMVSVSSRLRLAVISNPMAAESRSNSTSLSRSRPLICVCAKYPNRAFRENTGKGLSDNSSSAMLRFPNCRETFSSAAGRSRYRESSIHSTEACSLSRMKSRSSVRSAAWGSNKISLGR